MYIKIFKPALTMEVQSAPSMDVLASHWSAHNAGGVRVVRRNYISQILDAVSRAFNLRVADPYLPYHKQKLRFSWSWNFVAPKDGQDAHVHGLPAVEIYGIIEGHIQLWHILMNQRGVRMWLNKVLEPGDWMEVEPLNCHFGCCLERRGYVRCLRLRQRRNWPGLGK